MSKTPCTPITSFDDLVSTAETAELIGLKKGTLDRWRQTGLVDLKYRKVGRLVRYSKQDLLAYLNRRTYSHTGQI